MVNLPEHTIKLIKFYQILQGIAPDYLSDLFLGQTNNYDLRNADHIQGVRSNLFSDFFVPSTYTF